MSQTVPSDEAVRAVVLECLTALLRDQGSAVVPGEGTVVFGAEQALLDSMGLVNLIADLESRLEAAFGLSLVLADERAMSRGRSPFRTVATITAHVREVGAGGGS